MNTSVKPASRGFCRRASRWTLPVALTVALGVSNGPAVGIGAGAALALVLFALGPIPRSLIRLGKGGTASVPSGLRCENQARTGQSRSLPNKIPRPLGRGSLFHLSRIPLLPFYRTDWLGTASVPWFSSAGQQSLPTERIRRAVGPARPPIVHKLRAIGISQARPRAGRSRSLPIPRPC